MGSEADRWVECDETWYAWNPLEGRLDEYRVIRKRSDRVEIAVAGYRVGVVLARNLAKPSPNRPHGLHPTPRDAYATADRDLAHARHDNHAENRRLTLLHEQVQKAMWADKRLGMGRAG